MKTYDDSNINTMIDRTAKLISADPLIGAQHEVNKIDENFKVIHDALKETDPELKKGLWDSIFGSKRGFNFKSIESNVKNLFRQFDLTVESVEKSVIIFNSYKEDLEGEIASLAEFVDSIDETKLEEDDKLQYQNYVVQLRSLQNSNSRIGMRLKTADSLHKTMKSSRGVFQSVLSSCMLEAGGQSSLDSSVKMMATMTQTIEQLSNDLTESTIRTSKLAVTASMRPALQAWNLQKNSMLLETAFDEIKKMQKIIEAPKEEKTKPKTDVK